jgi:hypothetical protein
MSWEHIHLEWSDITVKGREENDPCIEPYALWLTICHIWPL